MNISDEMLLQYADGELSNTIEGKAIEKYLENDPKLTEVILKLRHSKVLMDYMKEVLKHGRK
jgi:anti-sigma factor RsiW